MATSLHIIKSVISNPIRSRLPPSSSSASNCRIHQPKKHKSVTKIPKKGRQRKIERRQKTDFQTYLEMKLRKAEKGLNSASPSSAAHYASFSLAFQSPPPSPIPSLLESQAPIASWTFEHSSARHNRVDPFGLSYFCTAGENQQDPPAPQPCRADPRDGSWIFVVESLKEARALEGEQNWEFLETIWMAMGSSSALAMGGDQARDGETLHFRQ